MIPGINWLSAGAGAVFGALATFGVMQAYTSLVTVPAVRDETRALVQAEARERAFELIEKRNADNEEISALDRAGLCVELGGQWLPVEDRCD